MDTSSDEQYLQYLRHAIRRHRLMAHLYHVLEYSVLVIPILALLLSVTAGILSYRLGDLLLPTTGLWTITQGLVPRLCLALGLSVWALAYALRGGLALHARLHRLVARLAPAPEAPR